MMSLKKKPYDEDISSDEHLHNSAHLNARKKYQKGGSKGHHRAQFDALVHGKKYDFPALEPARGSLTKAAEMYGLSRQNISRIWI
jgi:hypothetical protein